MYEMTPQNVKKNIHNFIIPPKKLILPLPHKKIEAV